MAQFPAASYISNNARTEGEVKQALEDWLAATKQIPGGAAESELTISSGSVTPTAGIHSIDTEADAASDDLTNIVQTNLPDGSLLLIRNVTASRRVVVKHSAGGAGQISLRTSADFSLDDPRKWLLLKRTNLLWEEVARWEWSQPSIDAKGDLIVGTAADAVARLAVGANRAILEADSAQPGGMAWVTRALGLKSVQVFTSSGTWTKPAGVRRVVVEVVGGGGGGGGTPATDSQNTRAGAGGGGGGYARKLIDVTSITSATITVGAGGAGGPAGVNPGSPGGASSWADGVNTVTANGGSGGEGGNAGSNSGGAGGTASGGDINVTGQGGGGTAASTTAAVHVPPSGIGGSSVLGGGAPAVANAPGAAGGNYGGGGSGADAPPSSGAARAGGNGAPGVVIVWEYE